MSSPHFKLISFDLCPYVQRARIVLLEKNVNFDVEFIDLAAPPDWFLELSPLGKVPVLLVDGRPIFESMAICEYLDEVTRGSLHPPDPFKKAQNRAWIEFGNNILSTTYSYSTVGDELKFKQLGATITERFDILEEQIVNEPFFNGDTFSIVDAVYAPLFRFYEVLKHYETTISFQDMPNVVKWWDTLLDRPTVINSVPASYMDNMIVYLDKQDSVLSQRRLRKLS